MPGWDKRHAFMASMLSHIRLIRFVYLCPFHTWWRHRRRIMSLTGLCHRPGRRGLCTWVFGWCIQLFFGHRIELHYSHWDVVIPVVPVHIWCTVDVSDPQRHRLAFDSISCCFGVDSTFQDVPVSTDEAEYGEIIICNRIIA